MSIVFTILLVIIALIALVLLVAIFSKKSYSIQRDIIINQPGAVVFDYTRFLKNQDHFNKWIQKDPNLKPDFRGTDGAVGFVYAWEGNKKVGKGEQEIMAIEDQKRLDIEIRFEKPFEGISATVFTTESLSANETRFGWSITSEMKYPMNAMLLFINIDKMLGRDLSENLGMLKAILEKDK